MGPMTVAEELCYCNNMGKTVRGENQREKEDVEGESLYLQNGITED